MLRREAVVHGGHRDTQPADVIQTAAVIHLRPPHHIAAPVQPEQRGRGPFRSLRLVEPQAKRGHVRRTGDGDGVNYDGVNTDTLWGAHAGHQLEDRVGEPEVAPSEADARCEPGGGAQGGVDK
ncbi:MAG: hypothetical protein SVT56_05895 [Chloroflexota bacterium]|nr:hypothetical protein [Chloroflexota bacterium]